MEDKNYVVEPEVEEEKALGMSLLSALKRVFIGRRIHREAWEDKSIYVAMISNQLCIKKPDGSHAWLITTDDVEAEDWEVWKPLTRVLTKDFTERVSESPTTGGEPSA